MKLLLLPLPSGSVASLLKCTIGPRLVLARPKFPSKVLGRDTVAGELVVVETRWRMERSGIDGTLMSRGLFVVVVVTSNAPPSPEVDTREKSDLMALGD